MEPISAVIVGVSLYVGDKILESKIQGGYEKIRYKIFGKKTYQKRLNKLVQETINELETYYPYKEEREIGLVPFYEDQKIVDRIVQGVFNTKVESFTIDLSSQNRLVPPEPKAISQFADILVDKIFRDKLLRNLEIEKGYKEQIFIINDKLTDFIQSFENKFDSIGLLLNSDEAFKILNRFMESIKNFNPKAAYKDIEWLEEEIERKEIKSKPLKAKILYLKGIALKELGQPEKAEQYFINANKLSPGNKDYQEETAIIHYKRNDLESARKISGELLLNYPINPVGWAIKIFEKIKKDENAFFRNNSTETPFTSRKFKEILSYLCILNKKFHLIEGIFQEELMSFEIPEKITFFDKGYWINLAQFFLSRILRTQLQSPYDLSKKELREADDLEKANQILSLYFENILGTEKLKLAGHSLFLFYFTNFLIHRKDSDLEKLVKFAKKNNKDSIYIEEVAICLISKGLYQDTIDLIGIYNGEKNVNLLQYKAISFEALGKSQDSRKTIISFLNEVELIDQYGFVQLIGLVELTSDMNELHKYLEEEVHSNKHFEFEYGKDLLNAFILFFKGREEDKDQVLGIIDRVRKGFRKEVPNYPVLAANICFAYKEFKTAAEILELVIGEFSQTQSWRIYLSCLYYIKNDIPNFLSYLKNWRDRFQIDLELLNFELDILLEIPDYPRILEICLIGKVNFPQFIRFLYLNIVCLHKLGRKEELIQILTSEDFREMPQNAVFNLVNIMAIEGYAELAIETLFPLASNNSNKKAREKYFYLFTYLTKESLILAPIKSIELGTSVYAKVGDTATKIKVDEISLIGDPRVNNLLGRKIGDFVSYENFELEISNIVNQYIDLQKSIAEEIGEDQISGYTATRIPFDGKIEEFHQFLIELYGKEGDASAYQNKFILQEYEKRKIGLGTLVRKVFNGDFLLAFNILTSEYENGFHICPRLLLENITLDDDKDYVIDLSIIPLFYSLSSEAKLSFKRKFFVSIFAKEFIEQKLINIQLHNKEEEQLSIRIQSSGVNHSFTTREEIQRRIEYLNNLLLWIDQNCVLRPVYEKSGVIEEMKNNNSDLPLQDWQFKYYIDTLFLANHEDVILISDDSSISKFPPNFICQISSEYFLEYEFQDLFSDQIIYSLLDRSYLGLQIKYENLVHAFESSTSPFWYPNSLYYKALSNLPAPISGNLEVFDISLKFLKNKIYLGNFIHTQQSKHAINVFTLILRGIPISQEFINEVKIKISNQFKLIPIQQKQAIDDFLTALNISNMSNS